MERDAGDSIASVRVPAPAVDEKGGAKPAVSAKLRGEAMAFAVQSAVFNLGANIFEPYINYLVQKHFAGAEDGSRGATHGNYTQNLAGEVAGDLAGAATLMFAELAFPRQLHDCSKKIRKCVDPIYDGVAHRVFAKDAAKPDYEKKIEEWKTFQERNLVRSLIVATAGIAGNLATQKIIMGNPSPMGLIFSGKLAGTTLTTALGLSVRLAFPRQMNALDETMGSRMFAPLLDRGTGAEDVEAEKRASSHVDRTRGTSEMHRSGIDR